MTREEVAHIIDPQLFKDRDEYLVAPIFVSLAAAESATKYQYGEAIEAVYAKADAIIAATKRENARLRAALKPFADYAEYVAANHSGWDHDAFMFTLPSDNAKHVVTLKPFRDAFRLLSAVAGGEVMDLDLQIELRLGIKVRGVPARIELDETGYWLVIEHRKRTTRIVLSDVYEPSILEALDDVSALSQQQGGK